MLRLLIAALAVVPAAQAQDDTQVQDVVVVIGSLRNVDESLRRQKESDQLVNVISADDFGKLPDFNAAEALQRLPGISLVQEAGEGRFVSIRGARPNYNGTLLNGFTVPSGDRAESRVDLQTVSNALIDSIEVYKAVTPDLPGEGIGGLVNIIQRNPAEVEGLLAGASLLGGVQQYDGYDVRADAYIANRFGAQGQFGFSLAGNYREGDREAFANEADGWTQGVDSSGRSVWYPQEIQQFTYDIERKNFGVDAAFGAVYDGLTMEVRGLFSRFESPNNEHLLAAEVGIATDPGTGEPVNFSSAGGLVDAEVAREFAFDVWQLTLKGVQSKAEVELTDNIAVDFGYSYLYAGELYPTRLGAESRSVDALSVPLVIQPDLVALGNLNGNPPAELNSSAYPLAFVQNSPREDIEYEHTPYLNISAMYDLAEDSSLELKGGLYFQFREKRTELIRERNSVLAGSTLTFAGFNGEEITDLAGRGVYFGQKPERGIVESIVADRPNNFGPLTTLFPRGIDSADYEVSEDIQAYFGMGTYKSGPFTLIAGARYEQTDTTLLRASTETANGLKYFEGDSDHWLPSIHLRYDILPEVVARASWSNTVARPDNEIVYANEVIDRDEQTIERANPALQPLTSENFDASLDWYFAPLSYVSAGAFYKDIDDFPLVTQQSIEFEGDLYTQFTTQAGSRGKVKGLELAYRQQFDFLPGMLSGLGVDVNVALIDSKLLFEGRPDEPRLQQQPDSIINASLIYAYEQTYARLTLSRTGKQINREGLADTDPAFDVYLDDRATLDLFLSHDITDNLQVFGEWRNITNASQKGYVGDSSRLALWEKFGTSGSLGVRWRY